MTTPTKLTFWQKFKNFIIGPDYRHANEDRTNDLYNFDKAQELINTDNEFKADSVDEEVKVLLQDSIPHSVPQLNINKPLPIPDKAVHQALKKINRKKPTNKLESPMGKITKIVTSVGNATSKGSDKINKTFSQISKKPISKKVVKVSGLSKKGANRGK